MPLWFHVWFHNHLWGSLEWPETAHVFVLGFHQNNMNLIIATSFGKHDPVFLALVTVTTNVPFNGSILQPGLFLGASFVSKPSNVLHAWSTLCGATVE